MGLANKNWDRISPPAKSDVKVSFHPAQVGIPKKEKASPAKVKKEEPKIMPFFELSDSPFLVFQPLLN